MEHRCYFRRLLQLPVLLWDGDHKLGCFETLNVSREGMFVQITEERLESLTDQSVLELLLLPARPFGPAQQLRGLVVHRGNGGVGLLCTPDIDDDKL